MNDKVRITASGYAEIPAYLTLVNKGYCVSLQKDIAILDRKVWIANRDGNEFIAEDLIELLGVVSMYESRGSNWRASDRQIEKYLEKYIN